MKRLTLAIALLSFVLIFITPPASATAIMMHYETVATDGGPGAGVDYRLSLTDTGSATFSIFGNETAGS